VTAVLLQAVLLLHLCSDGFVNVVQNYRLYPVCAIGTGLSLPDNEGFSGSDHLSILENTRWVRVQADLLPRQASTRLILYILLFAMLIGYERGLHMLTKAWCC